MLDGLLTLLLAGAVVLAVATATGEGRRLRREPGRREILAGEAAGSDRFHNAVAVLIAVVSISGALLAWRAARVSGAAEGRAQGANQALVRNNEVSALADDSIALGGVQTLLLQEHVAQARTLAARAAALRSGPDAEATADEAATLEAQADEERAVSRLLGASFLSIFRPGYAADGTPAAYDGDLVRATHRALNEDYRTLDAVQARSAAGARDLHRTARRLVAIGMLLTLTLFLLTLANMSPLHRRLWIFLPVVVAVGGALVTFVTVEGVL